MNGEIAAPMSRSNCTRALSTYDAGAERRPVGEAVVARVGLGEAGEAAGRAEVELPAVDDRPADRRAVAAEELGGQCTTMSAPHSNGRIR